jgi:glutamyl-tRNA reductase
VKSLSHAIINKVLHRPQTVLKEASHTGESGYYLEVTRRIFDLVETEGEREDRDRDER